MTWRIHVSPTASRAILVALLSGAAIGTASRAEALDAQLIDRVTGRGIAGAEVAIAGRSGTVRTDADGRFTWAPDPVPPFTVLILLADGRLAKPVRIESRTELEALVIQVDPAVDEQVVVSGSAPSVDAPPGASTALLAGAAIDRRAPANLMQVLEDVVGISGVSEGQSAVPAIRGLARGRTLVLLDGGRLFAERRAGPSVSFLAPGTMGRVDVVRGPASVAYGSDAFGGVIAILTKAPAAATPFQARLTTTAGAGVPRREANLEITTSAGPRAALLAAIRYRRTGDYSNPDERQPNSAWRDRGAFARASLRAGGWWTASWQADSAGESGRPRSDSSVQRVSSPFERSQRGTLAFDRSGVPGLDHVRVTGQFGSYEQRIDQDRLPSSSRPRRLTRADMTGRDVQVRAVAHTGLGTGLLTAGVDLHEGLPIEAHDITLDFSRAGDLVSAADSLSIASARRRDVGVFAQVTAPLAPAVTLAAGGRLDQVRSVNEGGYFGDRAVSHRAVSGLVSLAVRPASHLTLTAQVSRGFRDPTLSDRFYRGPVGRGFIEGHPGLEPERSVQIDLTARYDAGRWRAAAALYHYDITNLIERYQSGADLFLFRNRDRARLRGAEIEVGYDAGGGLSLHMAAQASRGRARDDGASLDDVPPPSIVLQALRLFGATVRVSARIAAIARDRHPGPSEVAAPGYVDAGAAVRWRVGRPLELSAAGSNLFNTRYYSSPGPRWVLAPGRNGTLTAVVTF